MTPVRLIELVHRALGRPGTTHELGDWAAVLHYTRDDDADLALTHHRASSPHQPTAADVRRHAIAIANDRAAREVTNRRRLEVETGIAQEGDHAGKPLKPMPPEIRHGLRQLATRHRVPDAPPADDQQRLAQARAELAGRQPLPIPADTTTPERPTP